MREYQTFIESEKICKDEKGIDRADKTALSTAWDEDILEIADRVYQSIAKGQREDKTLIEKKARTETTAWAVSRGKDGWGAIPFQLLWSLSSFNPYVLTNEEQAYAYAGYKYMTSDNDWKKAGYHGWELLMVSIAVTLTEHKVKDIIESMHDFAKECEKMGYDE